MSAPTVSTRTIVRDAIMAALETLKGQSTARVQAFDVSPKYLEVGECTRFPTYCVIVTDETPTPQTLQQQTCGMTVMIVIYVKDETDPRGKLDASIEDVYDVMLMLQPTLNELVWKLMLEELTTDEGARTSHPFAQAIQRWGLHHHRRATAA